MNTKQKIMLSAFVALFSGAMAAHAADEKAAPEKSATAMDKPAAAMGKGDQPKPKKKKMRRHSHPVDKGVMPPSSSDTNPASSGTKEGDSAPKKPMHDHKREMKGG